MKIDLGSCESASQRTLQNMDIKRSLDKLNSKFSFTFLGKKLRALANTDRPKTQILMQLSFGLQLFDKDVVTIDKLLETGNLSILRRPMPDEDEVGSFVCVYKAPSRKIYIVALDTRGKKIASFVPTNIKYRQENLSQEVYGSYLLSLFTTLSKYLSVDSSYPPLFSKMSIK